MRKKIIVNVDDLSIEKFTQGEWRTNQRPHGKVSIVGDHGQQVCLMWNSKEREANCDLISAAPDMYRALRKMVDMYIEDFGCDGLDSEFIREAYAALTKAKATAALAVRRNEGESPLLTVTTFTYVAAGDLTVERIHQRYPLPLGRRVGDPRTRVEIVQGCIGSGAKVHRATLSNHRGEVLENIYFPSTSKEGEPASHDWDDQDKCHRCGDRDWYASATCTPKQQPTPDVSELVEALEQVIKAAPSSGPLWHGSEQIVEARAALAAYREQGGGL